ncbi:MAG: PilZ domain-containing protein [Myxococcota bacterium]
MTQELSAPKTLIVHDGELADLCPLFESLGTPFTDRCGEPSLEDRETQWSLVIATPKRMLSLHLHPSDIQPAQIAVLDQESKTLRNTLRRAGIRLMVRRPVHRSALRALVLHALYRGPEKRRNVRVSIGAHVRYRAGWRQRPALLADLSLGGFRLLTHQPVKRDQKIALQIPAAISGEKAFSAKGRVLQCTASENLPGTLIVTARFEGMSTRLHQKLRKTIEAHASGPALYEGTKDAFAVAPNAVAGAPLSDADADENADSERRESARHAMERRVIALGDEASKVLMGRDISVGGMRVNPTPMLCLGSDLQLAVHVGNREVPLVVRARVHRDDGEKGMVLRFHQLDAEASRYLNEMMDELPIVDDDEGDGYLVTEILEAD